MSATTRQRHSIRDTVYTIANNAVKESDPKEGMSSLVGVAGGAPGGVLGKFLDTAKDYSSLIIPRTRSRPKVSHCICYHNAILFIDFLLQIC